MFRSNAAISEHSFPWVESGLPAGQAAGMAGSAIVREPIGVVAAITPFNFPFMLNVVKVAPALAVGCTVVLKPHPWTPLDAMLIAAAAAEAGIPPGVLNVLTDRKSDVYGKSVSVRVDLAGRRIIQKKNKNT